MIPPPPLLSLDFLPPVSPADEISDEESEPDSASNRLGR